MVWLVCLIPKAGRYLVLVSVLVLKGFSLYWNPEQLWVFQKRGSRVLHIFMIFSCIFRTISWWFKKYWSCFVLIRHEWVRLISYQYKLGITLVNIHWETCFSDTSAKFIRAIKVCLVYFYRCFLKSCMKINFDSDMYYKSNGNWRMK